MGQRSNPYIALQVVHLAHRQDLSIAGKRKGLDGERSGLFMDMIRIIKEMREADKHNGRTNEHIRPRFVIWENVAGAFTSNGGEAVIAASSPFLFF